MTSKKSSLTWTVRNESNYTFIEFSIKGELIRYQELNTISLPPNLDRRRGLVISGKGPVWLYAFLVHLAHEFAWVAVNDPRLGGGITVMNHLPDGPSPGTLIQKPE